MATPEFRPKRTQFDVQLRRGIIIGFAVLSGLGFLALIASLVAITVAQRAAPPWLTASLLVMSLSLLQFVAAGVFPHNKRLPELLLDAVTILRRRPKLDQKSAETTDDRRNPPQIRRGRRCPSMNPMDDEDRT
jgi:hypothetical protein